MLLSPGIKIKTLQLLHLRILLWENLASSDAHITRHAAGVVGPKMLEHELMSESAVKPLQYR